MNEETIVDKFDINIIKVMAAFLGHDVRHRILDDVINQLAVLKMEHTNLLNIFKSLEDEVNIDTKTRVFKYDKSYFCSVIETAKNTLEQYTADYSLAYFRLDIDDFSEFNNKYGHDIGDKVLIEVARVVQDCIRSTDYLMRFGGEEFDLILNTTDTNGASVLLESVFKKIRKLAVSHKDKALKITISGGLTDERITNDRLKAMNAGEIEELNLSLQARADDALYEAKLKGKDRFEIYSQKKVKKYPDIRKEYQESKQTQ